MPDDCTVPFAFTTVVLGICSPPVPVSCIVPVLVTGSPLLPLVFRTSGVVWFAVTVPWLTNVICTVPSWPAPMIVSLTLVSVYDELPAEV